MRRTFQLFAVLMLATGLPAFAAIEGEPVPAAQPVAGRTESEPSATTEQRLERLEKELSDARYERDIANIHADLIDRQTSWFEILVSVLLGGFGVIVSGVVIFFTFRFGSLAVQEAKQAIATEADEIRTLLEQAKLAVSDVSARRDEARKLLAEISPSDVPKDQATRDSLRELAEVAQKKPRADRTADDFRALINVAAIDEDWSVVEREASVMSYLFEDDPEASAFALFAKGYASGQLGRSKDEIAAYDAILGRFGQSDVLALQEQVAKALVNKGVGLRKLDKPEDAIAVYDDILARFDESQHLVLQQYVAKALINKGVALRQLEHSQDAIATYDSVLTRFCDSPAPALQEQVANALVNKGSALVAIDQFEDALAILNDVLLRFGKHPDSALQERVASALFNKACCYAKWKRASQCVEALEEWRAFVGKLNYEKIEKDADFDPVRSDPQFIAFLKENGYPPSPKPKPQRKPRKPAA